MFGKDEIAEEYLRVTQQDEWETSIHESISEYTAGKQGNKRTKTGYGFYSYARTNPEHGVGYPPIKRCNRPRCNKPVDREAFRRFCSYQCKVDHRTKVRYLYGVMGNKRRRYNRLMQERLDQYAEEDGWPSVRVRGGAGDAPESGEEV